MATDPRTLVRDMAVGEGVEIDTGAGIVRLLIARKKGSRIKCRIEAPPQHRITMVRDTAAPTGSPILGNKG